VPNEGGHTLDFEFRAQSRARRLSNSGSSENSPSETVRRGVLRQRLGKVPSVRRASQTDLSDAEWSYIEPHMPTPKGTGHPKIPLSARARLRGGGTLQAEDEEVAAKGDLTSGHYPEFIPPTVAEVRLLIRAMTAPEESRGVPTRMVAVSSGSPGAVARRSHEAAHRAKDAAYHDAPSGREPELAESSEASAPTIPVQANNETGLLTDAQWERVIERGMAHIGARPRASKTPLPTGNLRTPPLGAEQPPRRLRHGRGKMSQAAYGNIPR
jgi:hypothetical protein